MPNSSVSHKPSKPYPDFPLFPHATRRWAKKINGKTHYFGPWADPIGSLQNYLDQQDDLRAGRIQKPSREGLAMRELCNEFLTSKELQLEAGEIVPRTFADYYRTCTILIDEFGKMRRVADLDVRDFELLRAKLAKRYGVHRLGNTVQRVRMIFRYAHDAGLITDSVRLGPAFKRPSARRSRQHRELAGSRIYERGELQAIIDAADVQLKAMIYLGINCAYGNEDCGTLPLSALNLKSGWVNYSRPKTAVRRRCPLWPETIIALRASLAARPNAKSPEHDQLAFITKFGGPWSKAKDDNPISKEMRKLLDKLKLYRRGLGFYALRHTFATIASDSMDQIAINHIMGHIDRSMAANYRDDSKGISNERLRSVAERVRCWLFPESDP
jgi:integrase